MDPRELWKYAMVVVIGVALVLHAVFPRYDWRVVGADGSAILIYDRWGGTFQRANWDEKGIVKLSEQVRP